MELTTQLSPYFFLASGVAATLLGILAAWKIAGRKRWLAVAACQLPGLTLIIVAAYIWHGIWEDARHSSEIFTAFSPGEDLITQEQTAFQLLSRSSPRIRDGVIRLAFASSTNATLALPRMEILLQSALQLDPTGEGRENLWRNVVQPALQSRPVREVILLSAAVAAIGGYSSNRANSVLQFLAPLIAGETNSEKRSIELGLFVPLADFASTEQIESVANLLLLELLEEPNPMQVNIKTWSINPVGARRVRDLRRLASRLSGVPARRFADRVITPLGSQTNASIALALGKVLADMKSELDPNQVAQAMTNFIQQLPRKRDGVMQERAGPLTALAEIMTPGQAAIAMTLLLDLLRREPDMWYHRELTRPLKPLAQRLSEDDAQRFAEPIAEASSEALELMRDRIPQEQAYILTDRLMQKAVDTPNPTRRRSQVPGVAPLVTRLTPERAVKLEREIWRVFVADTDDLRRSDEASFLVMVMPQLPDEEVASLAGRIVEQMKQSRLDLPILVRVLTPLLPRANPATIRDAVACVLKIYDSSNRILRLTGLEQREFLLGAGLTAKEIERVLEPLVVDLENCEAVDNCMGYVTTLVPLGDRLSARQTERVANRMVFLLTQRPEVLGITSLAHLATNVTLTSSQAKRIADILLPLALECRPPDSQWIAAQCTEPFLARLDAAEAESTGQAIISTMAKMRGQMCAVLDAKCLLQLTNALQPDQARRLGDLLLQMPVQRGNSPGFISLMDSAQNLETRPPTTDWGLPSAFVEHQEKQRYQYRLEAWAGSLAGMMEVMTKQDAALVADQVAARCAEQGELEPMLYEEHIARVLQYASDTALNTILRAPFAVGGLRLTALRAYELKTGKSFGGNQWRFAASMMSTNSP